MLEGRAFEAGGRLPFQPIVDALRPRLDRENAPEDLLSDIWLAELGRLLPELRDRYPDLPIAVGDEAVARTRLFEAIARLGQALAQRAPLVLFLDDAQWADLGSLDLLQYAARRWAESGTPVLLLLTMRAEALAEGPALGDWLTGLRRGVPLTEIDLGPLAYEDTLRLVQEFGARGGTAGGRSAFFEFARRHGDYAIIGLAAHESRYVFFGAGATPVLFNARKSLEESKAALAKELDPPADLYNTAATKKHLAGVLLERAWNKLSTSR